jgi:hypothetical protein
MVDFFEVKLKFVVISYSDVQADEGALIVVKLLAKCCEVLVSVPLCVVGIFKCLLCLHVKGASAVVEVLKDLMWGDVLVCQEAMLELGVVLFNEGVA